MEILQVHGIRLMSVWSTQSPLIKLHMQFCIFVLVLVRVAAVSAVSAAQCEYSN